MTEDQKKRFREISQRWHNAERTDNRQTAQAIYDIGFLSGVIFELEEQIGNLKNPRP